MPFESPVMESEAESGEEKETAETFESETPLGDSPEIHVEEESSGSLIPDDY